MGSALLRGRVFFSCGLGLFFFGSYIAFLLGLVVFERADDSQSGTAGVSDSPSVRRAVHTR